MPGRCRVSRAVVGRPARAQMPLQYRGFPVMGHSHATKPLRLVPVSFAGAREFIDIHHRHHAPPQGHKFSIGLASGDELVGVATVGRPVARLFDNGLTLEVTRVAVSDDVPNGCSMLYGAAWRAAKALGYQRLITYTQDGEPGSSLRAAGWTVVAERKAHAGWARPNRLRLPKGTEGIPRTLWEAQ